MLNHPYFQICGWLWFVHIPSRKLRICIWTTHWLDSWHNAELRCFCAFDTILHGFVCDSMDSRNHLVPILFKKKNNVTCDVNIFGKFPGHNSILHFTELFMWIIVIYIIRSTLNDKICHHNTIINVTRNKTSKNDCSFRDNCHRNAKWIMSQIILDIFHRNLRLHRFKIKHV